MLVLQVALAFLLIEQALSCRARTCYICDSRTDTGCDRKEPPEKYLLKCPLLFGNTYAQQCQKEKVTSQGSRPRVTRDCVYTHRWTNIDYCDGYGICTQKSTCGSDGCNGSNTRYTINRSTLLIMMSIIFAFLSHMYWHWGGYQLQKVLKFCRGVELNANQYGRENELYTLTKEWIRGRLEKCLVWTYKKTLVLLFGSCEGK